jgi:3-hydroxyisobutyrate dehydrogenase
VWNRTPGKAKPLIEAGAKQVATPEDLAEHSEVVITHADRRRRDRSRLQWRARAARRRRTRQAVHRDEHGAARGRDRAGEGRARERRRFVECPVGGTTGPARQGKLFGFMGAEPGDAELAKPILDQLCRRLEHVGPVGNGALAKFTINMPLMIYYQALGEALAMARPMGFRPSG